MPIGEPHRIVARRGVNGYVFGERLIAAVGKAVERDAVVAILQADDDRRNLGRLEGPGDAADVNIAVHLGESEIVVAVGTRHGQHARLKHARRVTGEILRDAVERRHALGVDLRVVALAAEIEIVRGADADSFGAGTADDRRVFLEGSIAAVAVAVERNEVVASLRIDVDRLHLRGRPVAGKAFNVDVLSRLEKLDHVVAVAPHDVQDAAAERLAVADNIWRGSSNSHCNVPEPR